MITNGLTNPTAKAGDVICTITAKVTGEAGSEISLGLIDSTAVSTADLPDGLFKATVNGATTSDITSDTTSGTTSGTTSDTTSSTTDPAKPGNPGTGVALAVVPAVLAAAGVVVAKKRK